MIESKMRPAKLHRITEKEVPKARGIMAGMSIGDRGGNRGFITPRSSPAAVPFPSTIRAAPRRSPKSVFPDM